MRGRFPDSQINRTVSNRAPSLLASNNDLAVAARAAVFAYVRDYCLGSLPGVFDPAALPLVDFASSLGVWVVHFFRSARHQSHDFRI